WPMDLTQDQTNINLPNVYNNPSVKWSAGLSQDQTNNNLPIEWPTNNNPFMEWNADFTQYQVNTSLLNIHNNTSLLTLNIHNNTVKESSTDVIQNDENQTNHNLSMKWTACSIQDQTNASLLNIYSTGINQYFEQINTLPQYNA
ncbi:11766_t:CDS:2, partial [Dentiscutata erythropus]